jgi:hypothetical protein
MRRLFSVVFVALMLLVPVAMAPAPSQQAQAHLGRHGSTIKVTGKAWCGPRLGLTAPCSKATLKVGTYIQTVRPNSIVSLCWACYTFTGVPHSRSGTLTVTDLFGGTYTWQVYIGDPIFGTWDLNSLTWRW